MFRSVPITSYQLSIVSLGEVLKKLAEREAALTGDAEARLAGLEVFADASIYSPVPRISNMFDFG